MKSIKFYYLAFLLTFFGLLLSGNHARGGDDTAPSSQAVSVAASEALAASGTANIKTYAAAQGGGALLPKDTIYLRNNSNEQLGLYILNLGGNGKWELISMDARQEVLIPTDSLWLALSTGGASPAVNIGELRPEKLTKEPVQWNTYWVALLRQGHRYEICWDAASKTWRTGEILKHAC
ncbi:hypothetical protein AWB71_01876 [Caballeronia peredens]|nr:hypothetical protein AWB71_01876 [Caballeronia peredens]